MKCIIPLLINYCPIKKIAIIPFEKNPDEIYKCFELQYIDGNPYGNGYRIIAYRNDEYVDVYDDFSLKFQENEKFDVTINGLNRHIQVLIQKTCIDKIDDRVKISFSFKDVQGRQINFYITELSNKETTPMNLLAPIGFGSKKPNFLPLFFMYNFDFIRKKKTQTDCYIGEQKIKIDSFPLPMNMQFRYYARYSNQCELVEFINTDNSNLLEVDVCDKSYIDENVEYVFEDINVLSHIKIHLDGGNIEIIFSPSLNINENKKGIFKICPKKEMGYMEGIYEIKREDAIIYIKLIPEKGWISVPNSFLTKMILNSKSIFCRWSKNYEYTSEINIENKSIIGKWVNKN